MPSPEEIVKRVEALYIRAGDDQLDAYNKARSFVREFLASGLEEAAIPGTCFIIYDKRKAAAKAPTQRMPPSEKPRKNSLFDS